jgi:universal stress protein E
VPSIRRILVAIKNPAARSSPALTKATQLARALGARLELFHAIATPQYVDPYAPAGMALLADLEKKSEERLLRSLEKAAASARRLRIHASASVVRDYPVFEAILRRAARIKADLIVTDSHSRQHLAAGLLHLTDWELLRRSPVPVLIVKGARAYGRPVVLAALDPQHRFSKPSRLDDRILRAASTVTRALRGTLHAVHAFPPLIQDGFMRRLDVIERLDAQRAAEARRALDRTLGSTRIPPARRHVLERNPAEAITEMAARLKSSLVVMGAVSRSGLKRMLIGNTAESALDFLNCDILIVKPAHFRQRVSSRVRGARLVGVAGATPYF